MVVYRMNEVHATYVIPFQAVTNCTGGSPTSAKEWVGVRVWECV